MSNEEQPQSDNSRNRPNNEVTKLFANCAVPYGDQVELFAYIRNNRTGAIRRVIERFGGRPTDISDAETQPPLGPDYPFLTEPESLSTVSHLDNWEHHDLDEQIQLWMWPFYLTLTNILMPFLAEEVRLQYEDFKAAIGYSIDAESGK